MTGKPIAGKPGRSKSQTSLARLRALKDDEIDYSEISELPEGFWDDAEVVLPPHKVQLSVRFDDDLIAGTRVRGLAIKRG